MVLLIILPLKTAILIYGRTVIGFKIQALKTPVVQVLTFSFGPAMTLCIAVQKLINVLVKVITVVEAYIPTETTTIYLKPFQDTGEMILLSPSPDSNNSPFAEYLLLEYYTATGLNKFDCDRQYNYPYDYPQGPNTRGIRLWHVDARLVKYDRYSGQYSLTSNPPSQSNEVKMAMSNTYDNGSINEEYLSPLGSSYYNYNILQLIRNNTSSNVNSFLNNNLKSGDLFKANDTFSMSTYKYQFVKNGKLNTNVDLGFTFTVNTIGTNSASITVTKL